MSARNPENEKKEHRFDKKQESDQLEYSVDSKKLLDESLDPDLGYKRAADSEKNSFSLAQRGTIGHLTLVTNHKSVEAGGNAQLHESQLDVRANGESFRTSTRPDAKIGIGPLQANTDQIARAVRSFDPEIWELHGQKTNATADQVNNLRDLQKNLKAGNGENAFLNSLSKNETSNEDVTTFLNRLPPRMMQKINSWLLGETANEIMKKAQLSGQESRFSNDGNRLLKESILAVQLGHFPNSREYERASAQLNRTMKELRSQYPPANNWTPAVHDQIARSLSEQESKSEHWSNEYSVPTKNGRLGCASYITNGKVARELGDNIMPSLDLNMNGVVGESLIRGFQPRTIADALEQGKQSSIKHAMAFIIRPAQVGKDFKLEKNGHIGFFDASTGEVSQNSSSKGIGVRGPIESDSSFDSARQPWILVPPGWQNKLGANSESTAEAAKAKSKPTRVGNGDDLALKLTPAEKEEIGKHIWWNESAGKIEGLTVWNKGEDFPSLGIGHFLWMPKDSKSIFTDSFKDMIRYVKEHSNVTPPSWLKDGLPSPWQNKAQFDREFNGKDMTELRDYLSKTVAQQTDYLVMRLERSFPKILAATDPSKREQVRENYARVMQSGPSGIFALIDYINFKGEGINPQASYNGSAWGLRQVLENMKNTGNHVADFADSARAVLKNRVDNAPTEKIAQEQRWLLGWTNRIDNYTNPAH